jgi:hypothetical protein
MSATPPTIEKRTVARSRRVFGFRHVLAAGIGSIFALALNEIAIGIVAPEFNPRQQIHFIDPDGAGPRPPVGTPNSVTRQIKNTGDYNVTVRINQFGFRDSKDVSTARADDYLMVGDSFTFGWGVEEGKRMNDKLEDLVGQRVFNIGITGDFDTYQAMLDFVAGLGARIKHVIVCVTMENDVRRYGPLVAPETAPQLHGSQPASMMGEVKTWLMKNSALYFAATAAVHRVPWLEAIAVRAGLIVPNLRGIHDNPFDAVAVALSAQALARMAQRYDTTIVLIPSRALWHGDKIKDAQRTHAALVAQLHANGINVVDLRSVFEQSGKPLDYHFRNDGHWTPRGHELAAETIATHLRKR